MDATTAAPSLRIYQNPIERLTLEERIERRYTVQLEELNRVSSIDGAVEAEHD